MFGTRAQVVAAGLIGSLLVLATRWHGAPEPVRELFGGLPLVGDLPVWTATIGLLVAVLALLPVLFRGPR